MSLPTLVYVLPAALCFLAWLGLGSLLPARLLPDDRLLALLTRIAFGSAVYAGGAFCLGLAGLFRDWLFVGTTLLLAAPGAWTMLRACSGVALPRARIERILLGLVVAALTLDVAAAAAPPTSADALRYHLALPERWLELGRITDPFWHWEGYSPFGLEMLYAQGLSFSDGGEVAGVIGASFAVLASAAVFGLARTLGAGGTTAGLAGAALFVLQGIVTWEATSAFVELGLTFYVTLGVWFALRAFRHRATADAAWTSFCCGAAAATKFVALLPVAITVGALGALLLVRGPPRLLIALSLPGLAIALPWYARNAIIRGNPFFPLFFGGRGWSSLNDAELDGLEHYGPGGSPLRLAILPFDLLLHGAEFDRGRYVGLAIFVFAAAAVARRPRRETLALAGGVLVYLVAWWELSAQARFLLPPLAVLAATGAGALAALVRDGGVRRAAALAVLAAAVVAWALPSAVLTRQLLPAAVGVSSRAETSQRLTGTHSTFRQIAPRVDGTLALLGFLPAFHYPGSAVSLGPPDFGADDDRASMLRGLEKLDARYVLSPDMEGGIPQLQELRPCLRPVGRYTGRYVTSRALGSSRPLPLVLFVVDLELPGCAS